MSSKLEKLANNIALGEQYDRINIDLSNCNLDALPCLLEPLADSVEVLNLGGNCLTTLPTWFSKFRRLRTLFFANNKFESIPDIISSLPSLFMLSFKGNRISEISETCLPTSLGWLILTDNLIPRLPRSIGSLVKLRKVMLTGNRLEDLPDEMQNCRQIELLRLSVNNFSCFPRWLFSLPNLAWLALSGNPRDKSKDKEAETETEEISSTICNTSLRRNTLTSNSCSHGAVQTNDIDWTHIQLGSLLGEGASGYVYEGTFTDPHQGLLSSNRKVAVKMFKGDITSDGLPADEVNVLNQIGYHKSMISVEGNLINCPDNKLGVVLSLVSPDYTVLAKPPSFHSVTRDVYFEAETFDFKHVVQVASEVASVFKHLHDRRISHGDLYGHNILYNRSNGSCLISDFGAATCFESIHLIRDVDETTSISSSSNSSSSSSSNFIITDEFEKVEVLAFGILCDELVERIKVDHSNSSTDIKKFSEFVLSMKVADSRARPSFSVIIETLKTIQSSLL